MVGPDRSSSSMAKRLDENIRLTRNDKMICMVFSPEMGKSL